MTALPAGLLVALLLASSPLASAEPIGSVDTAFVLIGPDHKIVVDAYDDPKVAGVTCYVSRAKTGGLKGAIGVAEDKAEASIACRQVGPISFGSKPLAQHEEMFNERISLVFKHLRVVRMVDPKRNTLVYLSYSDRVIDGSPKNSVTAVPVDRAVQQTPARSGIHIRRERKSVASDGSRDRHQERHRGRCRAPH